MYMYMYIVTTTCNTRVCCVSDALQAVVEQTPRAPTSTATQDQPGGPLHKQAAPRSPDVTRVGGDDDVTGRPAAAGARRILDLSSSGGEQPPAADVSLGLGRSRLDDLPFSPVRPPPKNRR